MFQLLLLRHGSAVGRPHAADAMSASRWLAATTQRSVAPHYTAMAVCPPASAVGETVGVGSIRCPAASTDAKDAVERASNPLVELLQQSR